MTQNEMGGMPTGQSARKYPKFASQMTKKRLFARCLDCARVNGNSGSYKVSIPDNKIDHIGRSLSASGDNVFTELKRLIAKRSLTITVAVLDDEQIRVNVVPHTRLADSKVNEQIKYSNKSEVASVPEEAIKALTTPISITGTAEEIDAKFPAILCEYVESHVQLQETFDRASSEIAEAVKAIDERNKSKANAKTVKKEEKSKSEEPKPKADETLPLWWTDRTAAAPGTQPQPAPTAVVDAANPASQTF